MNPIQDKLAHGGGRLGPGRRITRRLLPVGGGSELAMDILPPLPDKQAKIEKRLAQYFLYKDSLEYCCLPHVNVWLWRRVRRDARWSLKVVVVMAPASAQS